MSLVRRTTELRKKTKTARKLEQEGSRLFSKRVTRRNFVELFGHLAEIALAQPPSNLKLKGLSTFDQNSKGYESVQVECEIKQLGLNAFRSSSAQDGLDWYPF